MQIDFMCGSELAKKIRAIMNQYYRDAGYYDDEPLRTIKFRRMRYRSRLIAQKRTKPLPLP